MQSEPNAEAGIYPFEECCEHPFRVHSSKACQMSGCPCKKRRQLPSLATRTAEGGSVHPPLGPVVQPVALIQHLQDDRWKLTHELVQGSETTMVITRIVRPDGTILDESAWTPE